MQLTYMVISMWRVNVWVEGCSCVGVTHMSMGHSHVGVTHMWRGHSCVGVTHVWRGHSRVGVCSHVNGTFMCRSFAHVQMVINMQLPYTVINMQGSIHVWRRHSCTATIHSTNM